jgi:hypothetical protein
VSNSSSPRPWLDSEGRFLFGKHAGEYVESDSVPVSYLEWIIENVPTSDIAEDDLEVVESQLAWKRRR